MTKVYYISRFRQRYELPDDVRLDRRGPLIYTKDFVGGGNDDESCAHWRQLIALRSKRNWLVLRGAFSELKNVAGNMSKEYRGYLLDSNFKPASVKEIGRWLGVSEKKAHIIIKELKDVGLIEYVGMPSFNGSPKKPRRARARPRKSGKRRSPLKRKTKIKANGKGNTKKKNKKRQIKDKPQKRPTPTTQPIKPQTSAKGGTLIPFASPSKLKNTELLGDIGKGMLHKYNPDAKLFALDIYTALELPWDPASENGRRELGCFASAWEKVDTSDELRARAIAEAKGVAKRRQNRKKGAVWVGIFQDLAAAYSRRRKIK
jgi:predicted metal-dependent hydrolase